MQSPFTEVKTENIIAANKLAFAFYDRYPVSAGHVLVVTRRVVPTWFDSTTAEQISMMALVEEVRDLLLETLEPKPAGFNVGFNCGEVAGQTVGHVHVHVIPRYEGDVPDPRGGVRYVIPEKANYLVSTNKRLNLSVGHPRNNLWEVLGDRLRSAHEIYIIAAFVMPSGLDLVQKSLFEALENGAQIRLLAGDYLHITPYESLERMLDWCEIAEGLGEGSFQFRLAELSKLTAQPATFHPKAWRVVDEYGELLVVGSSNLSYSALRTGVEWNLLHDGPAGRKIGGEFQSAFDSVWSQASVLTDELMASYKQACLAKTPPAAFAGEPLEPRPWQADALEELAQVREDGHQRALVAVATGLGKTWLAAFDVLEYGDENKCPKVLVIAHRAEILIQAEATLRNAMTRKWPELKVSWMVAARNDADGDLVIASVQKLCTPKGLAMIERTHFDYVLIDEVHHAAAPSYQRILARLDAGFVLGLTATPERADGVDVATLFDDVLAYQATVGDGIEEGSLVPFHYVGIKDETDFAQVPWRNGRFDLAALEKLLEASDRMERLWQEWQSHPGERTLVFCVSQRHALYARNWLQRKGVNARAVFAGPGSDARTETLTALASGEVEAVCAVDLFNEGLDVPLVDRVVFLRPTESKVVFLQQLGRGLRAAEGKARLIVLDFVGNHRIFAKRILHLLLMGGTDANWSALRAWLDRGEIDLPAGCILEVALEAKDLLKNFLPHGNDLVEDAYRFMRDDLERRPTPSELHHRGYLPSTLRGRHSSWFGYVSNEHDLDDSESSVFTNELVKKWFLVVETTSLTKSYKMIVLRVLLVHDLLWEPVPLAHLCELCRRYLLRHPVLCRDLTPTREIPDHAAAQADVWAKWWLRWPLGRWLAEQGGRAWFRTEGERFVFELPMTKGIERAAIERLTGELVDYRLTHYVQRRKKFQTQGQGHFAAKVSHSNGRPILRIPEVEKEPDRPEPGLIPVEVNGEAWVFKFVKVAVNVAYPEGQPDENKLSELMREWFGPNAGQPGTSFYVNFTQVGNAWSAKPAQAQSLDKPIDSPPVAPEFNVVEIEEEQKYVTHLPVYDLEAAAGGWGDESKPEELGWYELPEREVIEGSFIVLVKGASMEPTIPNGSWCLFRKAPDGSRNGKMILFQFQRPQNPDTDSRYSVKRYRSEKVERPDGTWEHASITLESLNPEFEDLLLDLEDSTFRVLGEFVRVVYS